MLERIRQIFFTALLAGVVLAAQAGAPAIAQAPERATAPTGAKSRVFVHADDAVHKRALIAIADRGLRHQYVAPGNELSFSAELTAGQIRAMERLGASIETVPLAKPMTRTRRYGALRKIVTPGAKPGTVCGNNICEAGENAKKCPLDCGPGGEEEPVDPTRTCEPQDQREYQTLLLSGYTVAPTAANPVKILVIDTGVNTEHLDLDVAFCRDATKPRIRDKCNDQMGHGTHTAGSAAAYGGADGKGLFGTAAGPGVTLGVEKICDAQFCFVDDMVRAIEDGIDNFGPDVISLSFGSPQLDSLVNAVQYAVDNGALFLVSAGNAGPGDNTIGYPASDANTVAVGMLDAALIANRMSSRGIDDGDDTTIAEREVELTGGGFVIESTSIDGCYETMSGTSMSTPSVAGFAAANWQGTAAATRAYLRGTLAEDVNNSGLAGLPGGYDDTAVGFDTSTGYGLPRDASGTDGGIPGVSVAAVQTSVSPGQIVNINVTGPADSNYSIGVSSPLGDWTYGSFTTNGSGDSALTLNLNTWTDPGTWLLTVDFGGGAIDFGAVFGTFVQTN